jgi:hypothetical protein
MPRQVEADILADHVDHRSLQLVGIDVLSIDPTQCLRCGDLGGVASGLVGAEIAAVAEDGEQIALDRLGELRIGAGGRAEVTGEAGPVVGILKDVEEMTLRHPGADFLLEFPQPLRLIGRRQLLQVRRPIPINAQLGVGCKASVEFRRRCGKFALQRGSKVLTVLRYAERGTIGCQTRLAFPPGEELGTVVGKAFGADHIEIAGLQSIS